MPDQTPATVRRTPRNVNADPAARRMAPISAADAEQEADRLAFPEEPLPPITDAERKAAADAEWKAVTKPQITLSTTVMHRGRQITITATNLNADAFCDLLDRRGFQAPEQAQEWQRLPDGTPICPKHHAPMRLREKQGDTWYSHSVGEEGGKHIYCKGYAGKDSPGYDL